MNSTDIVNAERASGFNCVAIIDDTFNPPIFGKLDREIQAILADPDHPEADEMIQLLIENGSLHESEGGEISLEQLQSSSTLLKLLRLLEEGKPREAERFFGKYLADRRPLLDLCKQLEGRGILADSITCIGPDDISSLGFSPDLVFLDLFLWDDVDESNLIAGVANLVKELNPPTRESPLFVILMSERYSMLVKLADSLRDEARLSINQFRFYSKQSLVSADGMALPLIFETLPGLRGLAAAQARLAESVDAALHDCGEKVRALILSMENCDFQYLAQQAAGDHADCADYLSELIGSYIEAELERAGGFSQDVAACFNMGLITSGAPPAPHIASTMIVRDLFIRARQRLIFPEGIRDCERPGTNEPANAGQEWRNWLKRFLPTGLIVGPEGNLISEGSVVYLHLSQDCDLLQESNPQSELSLLFVPAAVHNIDNALEKPSDRIVHLLVRITGRDWILRVNFRRFESLGVEQAYSRLNDQWYPLALLRKETADALRRRLANQLNRPAEPRIIEQRFDWQLTGVAIKIDSRPLVQCESLAVPCMMTRGGRKSTYLVQLPQVALVKVTDFLEKQNIDQLKGGEIVTLLTGVLTVKSKENEGGEEEIKWAEHRLKLPLNNGPIKKIELELRFEEWRSLSYGDSC